MQYVSRRFLIRSAALLPSVWSVAAQIPPPKKLKVVVAGGHPGDPEYGCGGTIAKYADQGHEIALVYLNHGGKGCGQKSVQACSEIRSAEAKQACQILGATPRFADQLDGESAVNAASYDSFHSLLSAENPDVVFTQWPIDNHRDHRATSNVVYDAWLRMKKSFSLYFYEVSDGEDTMMFLPSEYVDITATAARKRAACFAHASQTPERYYALQEQVARFRGTESGYQQAEAFIRHTESPRRLPP